MTSNKRSAWRAASRDLAAANHNRMSRRGNPIPTGADPATKVAAVKAAAVTRKHSKIGKMSPMHQSVKADLVARLQKLSADEREQLFAEAAAENTTEAGMEAAAAALSAFVRPSTREES